MPELRDLGAAYFADGEYGEAIDSFGRAIHLLRVNEGLYTHEQTGMVEQIIEAHLQVGNFIAADDQHEYLYRVRKANLSPADPEMIAAALKDLGIPEDEWGNDIHCPSLSERGYHHHP